MSKLSNIKITKSGKNKRLDFSKSKDVIPMPNFLEIQKNSYKSFIEDDIRQTIKSIFPVTDIMGRRTIDILDYRICEDEAKYDPNECKYRKLNYEAPIKVKARFTNHETNEIIEEEVILGMMPLMTKGGTFIINGAERVAISQIIRSAGCYFDKVIDEKAEAIYNALIMPTTGTWIELEEKKDILSIKFKIKEGNKSFPATTLIRMLGLENNYEIYDYYGTGETIKKTLSKDKSSSQKEAYITIYGVLRPNNPSSFEQAKNLINDMLFNDERFALEKSGRYKINKKLAFKNRVVGTTLARDVKNQITDKIEFYAGDLITEENADAIQNTGAEYITVNHNGQIIKVVSNRMVDISAFGEKFDSLGIDGKVYFPEMKKLVDSYKGDELDKAISQNISKLVPMNITREDLLAIIGYMLNLQDDIGSTDITDHLANKRIRCVGEFLNASFKNALREQRRNTLENMNTLSDEEVAPHRLFNTKILNRHFREFFNKSEISQIIDQDNILSEIANKKRITAKGPSGINSDTPNFEVRDIHYSHYGRICPIETPEGKSIGLVTNYASYAKLDEYGFLMAPYRKVKKDDNGEPYVSDEVLYLDAEEEEKYIIAQANEPLDKTGHFINNNVSGRKKENISEFNKYDIDFMDASPKMVFSVSTNMIPFLQSDDSNRALMGSNMMRQAVPLLRCEAPVVSTGLGNKIVVDSESSIVAKEDGVVKEVDGRNIVITNKKGIDKNYTLYKYQISSNKECMNQRPNVNVGENVKKGDVIADGPSTNNGELALGNNPLIGFMEWQGYNYEDAVLISDRLVKEDLYTSIHIHSYSVETREVRNTRGKNNGEGVEEITRNLYDLPHAAIAKLDENGIIKVGSEVKEGDILVGKITPRPASDETIEERILRTINSDKKKRTMKNTPLVLPHGAYGTVIETRRYSKAKGDTLDPGVLEKVVVYVAQKRKIQVGDKMAGRHGNKGIVSRIVPAEDMPYLSNGRPLDIVLNPLGVPSRMNIGQVLELHLGLLSEVFGLKALTPIFNGATEEDIYNLRPIANDYINMDWNNFYKTHKKDLSKDVMKYLEENIEHKKEWEGVTIKDGFKVDVYDGRTGEKLPKPISIGYMHYMKLHHMVDDKMHARSIGPYSSINQQPLRGKAQFGGQRFGEMEVWALEAYGVANVLREMLTIKSDDVAGRTKAYNSIIKGLDIPAPNIPETFKILIKTFQAIGLDVTAYNKDNEETSFNSEYIDLKANKFLEDNYGFDLGKPKEEDADNKNNQSESGDYNMGLSAIGFEAMDAMFGDFNDVDETDDNEPDESNESTVSSSDSKND